MESQEINETLMSVPIEMIDLVKTTLVGVHAFVYPCWIGDDRASVIAEFAVGDMPSQDDTDLDITLRISRVETFRSHYPELASRHPELASRAGEVALLSISTGQGDPLTEPLLWPLAGEPGSDEVAQSVAEFAQAARELIRQKQATILIALREAQIERASNPDP